MKNLLYIFILFFSFGIYSQGNLQFNKVININGFAPAGNDNVNTGMKEYSHGTLTVPEGKVWKITYAVLATSFVSDIGLQGYTLRGGIKIGDNVVYISQENEPNQNPFWLAEGTYQMNIYYSGGTSVGGNYSLSIIEFNIVP